MPAAAVPLETRRAKTRPCVCVHGAAAKFEAIHLARNTTSIPESRQQRVLTCICVCGCCMSSSLAGRVHVNYSETLGACATFFPSARCGCIRIYVSCERREHRALSFSISYFQFLADFDVWLSRVSAGRSMAGDLYSAYRRIIHFRCSCLLFYICNFKLYRKLQYCKSWKHEYHFQSQL